MFHNMPYSSLSFFSLICLATVQPTAAANELLKEENAQLCIQLAQSKKTNEVLQQEVDAAQKKVYEMSKGRFIDVNQTMSDAGLRIAKHYLHRPSKPHARRDVWFMTIVNRILSTDGGLLFTNHSPP